MTDRTDDGTGQWRSLPVAVKRVWLLRSLILDGSGIALCGGTALLCRAIGWWSICHALILGAVATLLLLELLSRPLRSTYAYAFNRYAIGKHDVMLRRGWLLRTMTTIPYNRVQHVETRQGPLLRRFRLTAVEIHTAVSEHRIEALDDGRAAAIVEQISARVLASKDDV